jgi:hypothetical protein
MPRHDRRDLIEDRTLAADGCLPTTGSVASRLGALELDHGYPTAATVEKLFDALDFQRACQAYLWALPLMAMVQWQSEHATKFGAGKLDYVDYLTFQDKRGLLTANATTPYIMAFPNLKESGPLVLEIPAGPTAGGCTDFWQRPITDSGQTGPDKGAGGRFAGTWLDGGKSYRLTVPKDVPVAQFWSVTVYDNETRCFVDTGVQPDRSSRDPIVSNPDGSVDLFFGPAAPAGRPASNWIETIPGKGWFSYFRLYGPTAAYFDRSWVLGDFEPVG